MSFKPYCPWCRSTVQRIDRMHWTCASCTSQFETAQRDGTAPPWADGLDPADTTLPEAFHENAFHQTFTGTIHSWMVHAQHIAFVAAKEKRKTDREAQNNKRIHDQVREALDRGIEPLLDRLAASNKKLSTLFPEVVAKDLRIEAMESLIYWNSDPESLEALLSDGFDEPTDLHRIVDYLHAWLGHVGTLPADDNVVLNDGGWRNHLDDDFASADSDDHIMGDEPVWLIRLGNSVPPGTSDEDIDRVAHAFMNAGAYLHINGLGSGRTHGYRWDDGWKWHLHDRLRTVGMQVLDDRLAAGHDLPLLYGHSFRNREAVEKLLAAGLSFSDMGPGAFRELVKHHPALALKVLKDGLPKHVIDPDQNGPFIVAVRNMLRAWQHVSPSYLSKPSTVKTGWYDACNALVLAMLDVGVNVNAEDPDGETVAILALDAGHEAFFRLLRRHGARLEPCIDHVNGLLDGSGWFRGFMDLDEAQLERSRALLVGIQQEELHAAMVEDAAGEEAPVGRTRRRL